MSSFPYNVSEVQVKGKVYPRAGHEGWETALLVLGARWVWAVNITPRPFTPGKENRYTFYKRLGGCQGSSGRMWKISPPTGIRSPDHSARSESLYRLSYPGPHNVSNTTSSNSDYEYQRQHLPPKIGYVCKTVRCHHQTIQESE